MMKDILKLLREDFKLPEQADLCFKDIRKKHQIPLWHIVTQIVLMPFMGIRSFLMLDIKSRLGWYKKLFNSQRKMISSDSTIYRILKWLSLTESQNFLLGFLPVFEKHEVLMKKFTKKGRSRRIGIVDGSFMGGHWINVLTLSGKINLPILIEGYKKRGKELNAAHTLLSRVNESLGEAAPQLYLFDSLYFNTNIFEQVSHELNAYLVIKSKDPEFRDVLKDARYLFQNSDEYERISGYDTERMCSYEICVTEDQFAELPIKIIKVNEYYSKRKKDRKEEEFYAISTDMSMDAHEIREAAHYRWQIENNVFKRLNEHCGTKNERTKNPRVFLNWIHLLSLGLGIFDLMIVLLKKKKKRWAKLRSGRKSSWKNIQSIFEEKLFIPSLFA